MTLVKKIKSVIKKSETIKTLVRKIKLAKMRKFPTQVQIETTSVCNSACITCSHKTMPRVKAHMSFDLFKRIIDDCAKNRQHIKRLALFFMGEPFLVPEIFEEIIYTKKNGLKNVFLISNGSVLTDEKAKKLLDSGLDEIIFSLDGLTKETFEKIRVGLDFDKVVANIGNLLELRKKAGKTKPKIIIDMVVTPDSEKEINQFKQKWSSLADQVAIRPMHYFEGMDKNLAAVVKQNEKKIEKDFPCPYLWKSMQILQDGRAAMCCMDVNGSHVVGDVNQSSLKEIWQGKILNDYRNLHLAGRKKEISICVNCDFYKVKSKPWWWF